MRGGFFPSERNSTRASFQEKTAGNFLFNQRKTALKRVDVSSAGSITMEDLISVLPFGGTFDLVQLKGSTLRKAFEHSVKRYGHSTGEFLQVSGIFDFISSIFRLLTELMPFSSTSTFVHAELLTDVSTSVTFPTGFHVEFDLSKPPGSRVRSLDILCTQCRVPQYEPVEDEAVYTVVLPSYMMTGGDGFSMIKNETLKHNSGEKFGYFSGFSFFGGILS